MPRILILIVFLASSILTAVSCRERHLHETPVVLGDHIVVDLGRLADGRPVFFTLPASEGGRRVDFFVVRCADQIESYLDACRKCYAHEKGFTVSDGTMLECGYCRVRLPIESLSKGLGSCYPVPVEGGVAGNEYRIPVSRLREQAATLGVSGEP